MTSLNLPLKNVSVAFILTLLIFITLGAFSWNSYEELKGSQNEALNIIELNGVILQYDEILTMSAKMASVTGKEYWEERYKKFEPQLDIAIKKLIELAPELFLGEAASMTDTANIKLVAIEKAAFKLVREGKYKQATSLLTSKDYEREKLTYSAGMQQIKNDLQTKTRLLLDAQSRRAFWSVLAALTGIPLLLFIWITTYKNIKSYIDKRKQIEEILRNSESKFRDLVELSPIGLALCKMDGQLVSVNPAYAKIIGHSVDDALKLSYWDVTPESYAEDEKRQMDEITKIGRYGPYEKEYIHKDGHLVPVRLNGMVVNRDGEKFIWSSVEDITTLKETEKENYILSEQLRQSHKMEAVGTLAGGIAHDFNNLLGIILGYAEMIRDNSPDNSSDKNHIKQILIAGNRAKDLVSRILSFSRMENKKSSPVSIHLLVKESINLIRSTIPTTIEIKQNIDPQCGNILANPTQIQQVLMNLCTNAAQSMDENGGVLRIELIPTKLTADDLVTEPNLKPGPYVRFSVKDNGIGIEEKDIDKIFDPYFTTKEIGKGSGMGLAVVVGIVKSYGGMITVDSKPGKGTMFYVYFPVIDEKVVKEIKENEDLPKGKEKVLVVDDEESIADMTMQRLENLGYQVTSKTNSKEALELFSSQSDSFDIVISDQTMPELTGEELAKKLLEIRPNIPIIICTGYSSKMDEEKAKSIGISAFIMKPVDKGELAKTIRQVLDENS